MDWDIYSKNKWAQVQWIWDKFPLSLINCLTKTYWQHKPQKCLQWLKHQRKVTSALHLTLTALSQLVMRGVPIGSWDILKLANLQRNLIEIQLKILMKNVTKKDIWHRNPDRNRLSNRKIKLEDSKIYTWQPKLLIETMGESVNLAPT